VAQPVLVSGKDGWRGIVHSWFGGAAANSAEAHEITIRLDSGEMLVVPDSILTGRPDGSYYVPLSLDEIRAAGPAPRPSPPPEDSRPAQPDHEPAQPAPLVIPVIHEELEVGKRKVETGAGVRIEKTAREEEQTVDLPLIHEQVDVQRVPVNRPVDGPVPVRHVGDTIVVPVIEEVLVVQKQMRLVEELHIRRTRVETREPQTFVLRKEEVNVRRLEDPSSDLQENQSGTDDLRSV
jgi:uncharacterized protein (TIGR02271 family)